ncbi:hypothetical protein D3C73_1494100 [compost metagenome]
MLRREHLTDNPRSAFVHAVEFTVAVIALNVAGGSDRNMHPGKEPMGFFVVARVATDIIHCCV